MSTPARSLGAALVLACAAAITCLAPCRADDGPTAKPKPRPTLKLEILHRLPAPEKPETDSPEAKIERALETRVRVELVDAPFDEFCRELAKKLGINVVLDPAALAEFKMPPDEWLTFSCRDLPVKMMLRETLRPIEFAWVVDCEVLLITTSENVEEHAELRVYDVADLVTVRQPDGTYDFDFEPLIGLIVASIEPDSWVDMGGPRVIEPLEANHLQVLVVKQTRPAHERIEQFLAALRSHLPKQPARGGKATEKAEEYQPTEGLPATPDERIHRLLDKRISMDLEDVPLTEFAARMAKVLGIPVRLDTETLEEAVISRDAPVTIRLTGI